MSFTHSNNNRAWNSKIKYFIYISLKIRFSTFFYFESRSPSSFSELDSTSSSNGTRTPGARSNKANSSRPPSVNGTSQITVEEERQSLTEHLLTWITRKVSTGQVQPFMPDIDYRVEVIRPKNNGPDLYTFVCLRCNTTLKAFKRSNGHKWNTANVNTVFLLLF